jgi:hypothetical protein
VRAAAIKGGSRKSAHRAGTPFVDVFQNDAREADKLREAILEVINRADADDYPKLEDTKLTIPGEYFASIRSRLLPLLYYGSFNLTKTRKLGYELTWKWTEATGKFVGCPYWSVQAKALFDAQIRSKYGANATLADARRVARELQSGKGQLCINHEHVFPISNVRQVLANADQYPQFTKNIPALRRFFEHCVVGCVVLEGEHRQVDGLPGTSDNPWLRYRNSSIKLVANPAWPDLHVRLIADAGLLAA